LGGLDIAFDEPSSKEKNFKRPEIKMEEEYDVISIEI
jgi:hypothetical protein